MKKPSAELPFKKISRVAVIKYLDETGLNRIIVWGKKKKNRGKKTELNNCFVDLFRFISRSVAQKRLLVPTIPHKVTQKVHSASRPCRKRSARGETSDLWQGTIRRRPCTAAESPRWCLLMLVQGTAYYALCWRHSPSRLQTATTSCPFIETL